MKKKITFQLFFIVMILFGLTKAGKFCDFAERFPCKGKHCLNQGEPEPSSVHYTDCKDVYDAGYKEDGVYTILPSGWSSSPFNVTCKMDHGGGWTVFQRRTGGSVSFEQNWTSYKEGFGNFSEDFWLGNEKLYYLTKQKNYKLRFDMTSADWSPIYAEFSEFEIDSEVNNYRMNKLGDRSGNTYFNLNRQLGKAFSTSDRDNDLCGKFNCAELHRSGWWHSDDLCSKCLTDALACDRFLHNGTCYSLCTEINTNGVYNGGQGETIFAYHWGHCNPKFAEMKIRRSS